MTVAVTVASRSEKLQVHWNALSTEYLDIGNDALVDMYSKLFVARLVSDEHMLEGLGDVPVK